MTQSLPYGGHAIVVDVNEELWFHRLATGLCVDVFRIFIHLPSCVYISGLSESREKVEGFLFSRREPLSTSLLLT